MSQEQFIKVIDQAKKWIGQEFTDQKIVFLNQKPIFKKALGLASVPTPVMASSDKIIAKPLDNPTSSKQISIDQMVSLGQLIQAEVLVIVNSQDELEKTMMEKMAAAIGAKIAKAMLIHAEKLESHKLWKDLFAIAKKGKKILISEKELYELPHLLEGYQKLPERKLFGVSLFLLADLKSYLQDIELKKSLWASLLREI